ncbi:MAG: glycosyltransferase [Pseudomonadota bacterium]
MRVLLAVTSLMGAGHLNRTLTIARALRRAGAEPLVVSGGREIAHLDADGVAMAQLPPVWSDGVDYSRLLTPEGVADQAYLDRRRAALLSHFADFAPDAVVTELWPFGRRNLSAEFEALAEAAAGKARLYASIRDVLEPKKKPKRAEETADRLRRLYDGVLVHGDPKVVGLGATWPKAAELADLIRYTGYVCDPPPPPAEDARGEVLVAVGGGVIGRRLLETAVAAAGRQTGDTRLWRLRVGGADAAAEALRLTALAGDAPVVAEPAAADYRARLGAAACSVSLLGYNTATDILTAGVPAVIAPMEEGGEKEQRIRAAAFARLPGIAWLEAMDPETLLSAVQRATALPGPPAGLVDLNGAETTARIVLGG